MGLFIRNQDPRSDLQNKVAAELQERLRQGDAPKAEEVEPAFNENQHNTRPVGVIVIVLIVAAVIVIAVLV